MLIIQPRDSLGPLSSVYALPFLLIVTNLHPLYKAPNTKSSVQVKNLDAVDKEGTRMKES